MPEHALLTIESDAGAQQVKLEPGTYVIGKDESCDVVVSSLYLRREHARITLEQDGFEVVELGVESESQQFPYPGEADLGPLCLNLEWQSGESSAEKRSNYAAVRELARGGMGRVFEARDEKLKRKVAMKVLLQADAGAEKRARFVQEARALGQLDHPNIVPIHDLGKDDKDHPFYTMKLVQGGTLNDILKRLRSGDAKTLADFPLSALLTIFQKVCDAIAFAHSRGIIHRDLKPQNIMVGEFGETLVMDWGLAKFMSDTAAGELLTNPIETSVDKPETTPPPTDLTASTLNLPCDADTGDSFREDSQLTMEGSVLGTPHYMSPEQAKGKITELDERTDVYSLGGILYAILTLRPPLDGKTVEEILQSARDGDITEPASFIAATGRAIAQNEHDLESGAAKMRASFIHCPNGKVPEALSAVTMKALSHSTDERYQSVTALSADIAAYQGGFATQAEEAGTLKQLQLFVSRHKGLALSAAVVLLLSAAFMVRLIASERKATQNAELATANAETAKENERRAEVNAAEAAANAAKAKAEAERATAAEQAALKEKETARDAFASAQVALAEAAYRAGDGITMRVELGKVPPDLRSADHDYLNQRIDTSMASLRARSGNPITSATATPGRPGIFAVTDEHRKVSLIDAHTGRHLSSIPDAWGGDALAFSRDGSMLAAAKRETGSIHVLDTQTEKVLAQWKSDVPVQAIQFSPDERRVLITSFAPGGKSSLQVHSARTGERQWRLTFEPAQCLAHYLPSGSAILATGGENQTLLLDSNTGEILKKLHDTPNRISSLAIGSNGQFALLGDNQGRVRKISLPDGRTELNLGVAQPLVSSIVLTPDNSRFVTLANSLNRVSSHIEIWDTVTGDAVESLLGIHPSAESLAIHPESSELIVTGEGAKSWDLFQLRPSWTTPSSLEAPWSAFGGDEGRLFFSKSSTRPALARVQGGTIRGIWTADHSAPQLHVSPGGDRALAADKDGRVSIFDLNENSGRPSHTWKAPGQQLFARLDRTGKRVWIGTSIHDANSGNKLVDLAWIHSSMPETGAWLGEERLVAGLHQDVKNFLRLYDAKTGEQLRQVFTGNARTLAIVSAPDGASFAEAVADKRIRIRDRDTLDVRKEFRAHDKAVTAIAFHPEKPMIASASEDLSIRLWDLSTGALLEELRGPLAPPRSLAFSPNGLQLACSSEDRATRIWEPRSLRPNAAELTSPAKSESATEWLDLIAALAPEDFTGDTNKWTLTDGELRNPRRKFSACAVPGDFVNQSYHLQVQFRCVADNESLTIFTPVGTRQTGFLIDGYPFDGWRATLHFLDGDGGRYNPNATLGRKIQPQRTYQLDLFVRLSGPMSEIEVMLDSQPLYRWQGLSHRLSRNPRFRDMPPGQIGFGAHYIGWIVSSAKVRRL